MKSIFSEIYRPSKPQQLIGEIQREVAESLCKRATDKNPIQQVLFSGPSGVGKTTISKIYIRNLLSLNEDDSLEDFVILVNCTSERGINEMRDVMGMMDYQPLYGDYKVFFLDEIHGLTPEAQGSLLIKIENLPDKVIVVGSTTNPDKLIPTLRSRFVEYRLTCPSNDEFRKLSSWIDIAVRRNGGVEYSKVENKIRDEIILMSKGNIRAFVNLIQQFYEGSYKGVLEEQREDKFIGYMIINNRGTLSEWFKLVSEEKNYTGLAIGVCEYCIKVIQNSTSVTPVVKRAEVALTIFGSGLGVQEKISFYSNLLKIYKEIKNV